MSYSSVLIVTYGRSGSTLLQGVLNSLDGFLVKGENNGVLLQAYCGHERLLKSRMHQGEGSRDPWYGIKDYDLDAYVTMWRDYMHRSIVGDRRDVTCYGFKEIRYLPMSLAGIGEGNRPEGDKMDGRAEAEALKHYLSFLRRVFPECAIVFNKRCHDEVVVSNFWKQYDTEMLRLQLNIFEASAQAYLEAHDHAYMLDYTDMCERTDRFWRLFDFLGVKPDRERIVQTLSCSHSVGLNPETAKRHGFDMR